MQTHDETSSPEKALAFLCALFPDFGREWYADDERSVDGDISFHRIMQEFTSYFGGNVQSLSEAQLKRFGAWLSNAVLAGGDVENAVSTCFIEHMHQIKVSRLVTPHLSKLAKAKLHA